MQLRMMTDFIFVILFFSCLILTLLALRRAFKLVEDADFGVLLRWSGDPLSLDLILLQPGSPMI